MGVILLEGIVVTILVLVGFREAVMNAVPLALKKAIGVGIGLFILFIGFANGGLRRRERPATPVTFHLPDDAGGLRVLDRPDPHHRPVGPQDPGGAVISILVTTVLALIAGVTKIPRTSCSRRRSRRSASST